jgi:hypothetical protein
MDTWPVGTCKDIRKLRRLLPRLRESVLSTQKRSEFAALLAVMARFPAEPPYFPFHITLGERPDLVLRCPVADIGVEVTEAQDMRFRRAKEFSNHKLERWTMDAGAFRRGGPKRIRNPAGRPLASPPYTRDEEEQEWSAYVIDRVADKSHKLIDGTIRRYPINWLIVDDLVHFFCNNQSTADNIVVSKLKDMGFPFDCIFVVRYQRARYLAGNPPF